MKKRIIIAGNSHFLREYVNNGLYFMQSGASLSRLYKKYEVYNLSKKNLTSSDAYVLTKAFLEIKEFDLVFLALGEGDIINGISTSEFKNNIKQIINLCKSSGVSVVLHNQLKKKEYAPYSLVIDELQNENEFEFKYVSNKLVKA